MFGWWLRQTWRDRLLAAVPVASLVFICWTALSSFALTRLLGVRDFYTFSNPESYFQWWAYLLDDEQPATVNISLLISGAIGALPWAAVAVRMGLDRRTRKLVRRRDGRLRALDLGVTDNHGHAAFAPEDEVLKHFRGPGCVIGAHARFAGAAYLYDNVNVGPGHSMVFAGPGSDKTTTAVTRIWHWPGPCVVFDPSCEIGPIMTDALRKRGRRVVSIGLKGDGVNALDWIDTDHPEADAFIRSAVDWIYNEGATSRSSADQSRDPFWSTWGRALVSCLMAHMLYASDGPRTLSALRQGISTPENEMPKVLRGIHASSASRMARDLAGGLMGMKADETFSGIYANAFAATEWLSITAYADVVSGSAMRTSDILNSDIVVFVQLPMRSLIATPAVGRAVLGALFNAMFHADGTGIADRILFLLDEAWLLGRLNEVMLCHSTARKYRGCVQQIFQSEGQLEVVWGREGAKTMRDTLSWRSYNSIQDGEVAEKLSADIGEYGVMAYSEGINTGRQKPWGPHLPSSSSGSNLNTHEIKRRVIKRDEILRSPADRMFVLARDFPWPIDCCTAPYYRYADLNRVMQDSRFVTKAAE